jgi:hypothetical protein
MLLLSFPDVPATIVEAAPAACRVRAPHAPTWQRDDRLHADRTGFEAMLGARVPVARFAMSRVKEVILAALVTTGGEALVASWSSLHDG